MNLKEIRDAMFAQADWDPSQSPEAKKRVNGFINRAYNQLALEAPFLFFESEVHLATEPEVLSKSANDTIQLATNSLPLGTSTADPWTFMATFTTTTANDTANYNTWKVDRSWDGRNIDILDAADSSVVYRTQIRSVWKDSSDDKWKLTITAPAPINQTPFKYRIYTEEYALPDDVIQYKSARLYSSTLYYPLQVLGQNEVEDRSLVGQRSQIASGLPRVIFRRRHTHLQGPSVAPEVRLMPLKYGGDPVVVTGLWTGPDPPGKFQYIVTYSWGKRDADFRNQGLALWKGNAGITATGSIPGPLMSESSMPTFPTVIASTVENQPASNRYREPRFESAPSPASEEIEAPSISQSELSNLGIGIVPPSSRAIAVIVPNIEYMLGFLGHYTVGSTTYTRASKHQSGVHVRVYRRRLTADMSFGKGEPLAVTAGTTHHSSSAGGLDHGQPWDYLNKLDISDSFYLLAEFRVDEVNNGIFYDDGQIIPDYSRRLRDIHGYQTFGCYPRPDKRYVMDIRCIRRPQKLENDDDVPLIHAEATNVLIQRAISLLYENMGNPGMSEVCMNRYKEELYTLSKRYGDLRPPQVPIQRRATRASASYRRSVNYRKWYDSKP